jgi:hypothetical protein
MAKKMQENTKMCFGAVRELNTNWTDQWWARLGDFRIPMERRT